MTHASTTRSARLLLATIALIAVARAAQESPPVAPPVAPPAVTERPKSYMGRPIAPFMSYEGGPWLMRITREKEEGCSKLLAALELKEGASVADFGCGNGFYTFPLAKRVGAKGRVYAVDLQPQMLELLAIEAKRHDVGEVVVPVLCTEQDPKLPDASIDLAFLVDVYHELTWPAEVLAGLKRALKPDGQIVLVEFRLEDPEVPIKLEHKMTKVQVKKELLHNGFELVREYDELPWQHVLFFRVAPPPAPAPPPAGGR